MQVDVSKHFLTDVLIGLIAAGVTFVILLWVVKLFGVCTGVPLFYPIG